MSHPLEITGHSDDKALSRSWMFATYRKVSGNTSLPEDYQYWTLAGQLVETHEPTRLQPTCEAKQAIRAGLIAPTQFIGVEVDPTRALLNSCQSEMPDLTLVKGDLFEVMVEHYRRGRLKAGIVNIDTAHEPAAALKLLAKINRVLRATSDPVVVFLNVVMGNRYREHEDSTMTQEMLRLPDIGGTKYQDGMLTSGWSLLQDTWVYPGSGANSRSCMKVYCLIRGFRSNLEVRKVVPLKWDYSRTTITR